MTWNKQDAEMGVGSGESYMERLGDGLVIDIGWESIRRTNPPA